MALGSSNSDMRAPFLSVEAIHGAGFQGTWQRTSDEYVSCLVDYLDFASHSLYLLVESFSTQFGSLGDTE